ncbi:MAG TPA: sporulation protein YqfC [Clostridia bacterium]|jgi:sporulation protein YqfC|nr:sporulation protein YqfC [Clostridia bacterium]
MYQEDGAKKVTSQVADLFEIPRDIVMNLPKLTLIGNMLMYLENHRGIIQYDPELIRVNLMRGELRISGQNLIIRSIISEEIVVEGRIDQVSFVKED